MVCTMFLSANLQTWYVIGIDQYPACLMSEILLWFLIFRCTLLRLSFVCFFSRPFLFLLNRFCSRMSLSSDLRRNSVAWSVFRCSGLSGQSSQRLCLFWLWSQPDRIIKFTGKGNIPLVDILLIVHALSGLQSPMHDDLNVPIFERMSLWSLIENQIEDTWNCYTCSVLKPRISKTIKEILKLLSTLFRTSWRTWENTFFDKGFSYRSGQAFGHICLSIQVS